MPKLDAETIYSALRAAAEEHGFVGDHADDLLGQAAESIAEDPANEDDDRGPNRQFHMYDRAGNDAVADVLVAVQVKAVKDRLFRNQIVKVLREGLALLQPAGHPEWTDTEPRGAIVDHMNTWLDVHGFKGITEDDLF